MLRLKCLFFVIALSINLYSIEVLVTNSKINYKEIISVKKLSSGKVLSVKKFCIPATISDFENNKYYATRYLRKGSIICLKDIEKYSKNSILFNFGSIQIERDGELIFENDEYIKIKKRDGKIEKIYKDGRLR
ncbi:hypothetical protein [Arcobacter sp. LA11]|uniref:hypothetical protein n=1 Tax=Arcobacter sp. LA11 TaxID=1898176 RepID=UPI0009351174|nr:hypothetical protein [Arcobacter sp. LA11]